MSTAVPRSARGRSSSCRIRLRPQWAWPACGRATWTRGASGKGLSNWKRRSCVSEILGIVGDKIHSMFRRTAVRKLYESFQNQSRILNNVMAIKDITPISTRKSIISTPLPYLSGGLLELLHDLCLHGGLVVLSGTFGVR